MKMVNNFRKDKQYNSDPRKQRKKIQKKKKKKKN